MASTSGQQPSQNTSASTPNGQQSQIPQSALPKTRPGLGKLPADTVYSNNPSALERLFASFIVSFRRIGIFFPTIAFFTTLVFFLYYGSLVQPLITLYWKGADGGFLILVEGFLSALVIALVYAFCSAPFVTSSNKSLHDYDLLEIIERKLHAYFDMPQFERETAVKPEADMIEPIDISSLKQDTTKLNDFNEARSTYLALYKRLYFPKGRQLLSNTGDLYAWGLAHSIQEALTAIKTTPTVFREAVLDYSVIRNSPIDNRDELLEHLTRAIKNFGPHAREYLKDLESDKKLASLQEDIQKLQQALENKDITPKSSSPPTQEEQTLDQKDADTSQPDSETFARATICSVKERLHDFQEDRLAGILHARNNLILSTAASGLITYAFLFLSIASIVTPVAPDNFTVALASAITLYVIGVAAGLFGRLYAEAHKESAANDYGLSQARLQAIPIISGIAAMGGIFVAAATLSPTNGSVDLMKIFTLNIQNILVALIFGFAPNLLIRNLQRGADRYVSDLESTRKKG